MPSFSRSSESNLVTCHYDLQRLLREFIKIRDFAVIEGRRDKATQDEYFRTGRSHLQWPHSKHNYEPPQLSRAVDIVPYLPGVGQVWPQDNDPPRFKELKLGVFYLMLGELKQLARQMEIGIRLGADWDGDGNLNDQRFHDLPHVELL